MKPFRLPQKHIASPQLLTSPTYQTCRQRFSSSLYIVNSPLRKKWDKANAGRILSRRHASSAPPNATVRIRNFLIGTALGFGVVLGYYYITDTRAGIHRWAVVPALRYLYPDAEEAHVAGTKALKGLYAFGLHPRERGDDGNGDLAVEVFGQMLTNPIAISGGLDKNADIPTQLFALGTAIVEVGGVTPLPQEGNPKPRVFRLPSQRSLINRYGLNSDGAENVAVRLRQRVREFAYNTGYGLDEAAEKMILDGGAGVPPGSLTAGKLLAVQIAKNKTTPDDDIDAVKRDYVVCVEKLGKYADIIVVNVSSPNTPGLRDLQKVGPLSQILTGVVKAAAEVNRKTTPRVMVKVSPDERSDEQVDGICRAVWDSGVDGVIVGNTTKSRPTALAIMPPWTTKETTLLSEQGGFSGPHLFEKTRSLVARYRQRLDDLGSSVQPQADVPVMGEPGKATDKALMAESNTVQTLLPAQASRDSAEKSKPKVIFASGGITSGKEALEVLNAGASCAMIYTALSYGGVGSISRIKEEIRDELRNAKNG